MLSLGLLWSVADYLVFGTGQLLVHICELIIVRCVVSTSVLKFIHRWTMLNGQGQGKREEPWEKKGVFALSRQSQVGFCDYVVTRIALCKLTFPSCSAALLLCKGIFRNELDEGLAPEPIHRGEDGCTIFHVWQYLHVSCCIIMLTLFATQTPLPPPVLHLVDLKSGQCRCWRRWIPWTPSCNPTCKPLTHLLQPILPPMSPLSLHLFWLNTFTRWYWHW